MEKYPLKKEKINYNIVNIILDDYIENSYYKEQPELFVKLQQILNGHVTYSVSKTLNMECHKDIKELMIQLTPNMPIEGHTMNERFYWILHDLHDFPICQTPNCINGKTKLDNAKTHFKGLTRGYQKHCCNRCAQFDPETTQTKKNTTFKRHGDSNYRNPEKTKQTYINNYGVEHPMKSNEYKKQLAQHNLEEYGYEWWYQSNDCKQRQIQAIKNQCGEDIVNVFQATSVKKKLRETWMKNYGVDNPSKDPRIKAKKKVSTQKTSIERYGTLWPIQNPEVFKKVKRKLIYNDIQFDSFSEIAYYIWLTDNNIKFEYQPNITFEYEYDNVKHYYHPDFLLIDNNEIVEIKNKNTFKDGKMINIYDRSQDGIAEAKHQCMLKNNVKILIDDDYKHCIQYVKQKFGKDFRKKCIKHKEMS